MKKTKDLDDETIPSISLHPLASHKSFVICLAQTEPPVLPIPDILPPHVVLLVRRLRDPND
jgi:hypothetical protein